MHQYLIKELISRGFFESNGILSKFSGSNQYVIQEKLGSFTVERTFQSDNDTKNRVLDYIQSLAGRYALTAAQILNGKLVVTMTKPGQNAQIEAVRIDYLIQSIDSGIENILIEFPATEEPLPTGWSIKVPPGTTLPQKPAGQVSSTPQMEPGQTPQPTFTGPKPKVTPLSENPLNPTVFYAEETEEDEIIDEDEFYKYKTDQPKNRSNPTRSHFPKEAASAPKPRLRNNYIPQETGPDATLDPHPVYARVVDRRFSVTAFIAAGMGAVFGAVLMGVVRTLEYPAQPVALLIPFLVIGIYRLIAGFQIPIWLGVTFVLGSIIMGSVLITTTDILSASNVGFLSALKGGILAHVDNTRYFVATVWLKIGLSILIASVPTMLLLAWGKRKTKVL